jgi:hypothetical protein
VSKVVGPNKGDSVHKGWENDCGCTTGKLQDENKRRCRKQDEGLGLEFKERKKEGEGSDSRDERSEEQQYKLHSIPPAGLKSKKS